MNILTEQEILNEFRQAQALLEGHFVLSSGLHSATYLQCALVMRDAPRAERLCFTLAEKIKKAGFAYDIDVIISPAMGGVVVGYEMGRQLNRPSMFFERVEGEFVLRRGFDLGHGEKCLLIEDVVTTGLSSRECIAAAERRGATVVGAAALVDRSGGRAALPVPFVPLIRLDIATYTQDQVPASLAEIPPTKPGSRWLRSSK